MIEVRNGRIDFPSCKDFGPQQDDQTQSFAPPVNSFAVILTGYELRRDSDDHHLNRNISFLTALLRDGPAWTACDPYRTSPEGKVFTLKHLEVETRGTLHQASRRVNAGQFEDPGDRPAGIVRGVIDRVSISGLGVLKDTNEDLADVAKITLIPTESPEPATVELFLAMQRPDTQTSLSILQMLIQAHREGREVSLGFYLEPLRRSDDAPVRWIQQAELRRLPDIG